MCRLSWFLDPGGWSKTAAVGLYFIFPGICTLSLILAKEHTKCLLFDPYRAFDDYKSFFLDDCLKNMNSIPFFEINSS
ncbi:hypothetical protein STEG23_001431 [Scotinomys teguina]